jgi:hypothetical protein
VRCVLRGHSRRKAWWPNIRPLSFTFVGRLLAAELPNIDLALPLFVYGALKPDEIAYHLVAFGQASDATARGDLYVRDGLALFDPVGVKAVQGAAIDFDSDRQRGYAAVAGYEPDTQYRWVVTELLDQRRTANVLAGLEPKHRSMHLDEPVWRSSDDPAFNEGLDVVVGVAEAESEKLVLLHSEAWRRFFNIQATYLLLWSIIERYASLAYGPGLTAREKADRLANDPLFAAALRHHLNNVSLDSVIYDAADPHTPIYLSADPLRYMRQIRHNLIHRGKAASHDGERVRLALKVLAPAFRQFVDGRPRVA